MVQAIIFLANQFHLHGLQTLILRDEDIQFPPNEDAFDPSKQPVVKDLTAEIVIKDLAEGAKINEKVAPQLDLMRNLVIFFTWACEPDQIQFLKPQTPKSKNKKKNKSKKEEQIVELEVAAMNQFTDAVGKLQERFGEIGLNTEESESESEVQKWAKSTFDYSLSNAMPQQANKKHF